MILVTGGLGFIGSHTVRALLDSGEDCVVTQHRKTSVPDFLRAEIGTRVIVEPVDITDGDALRAIGSRHPITGVVHLADSAVAQVVSTLMTAAPLRFSHLLLGLGNILDASIDWGVSRVTIASTVGVYGGVGAGPWREDMLLPLASTHGIPAMKKIAETLGSFAGTQTGLPVVFVRPSSIWGPGGRSSSFVSALPELVHAAARTGEASVLQGKQLFADDVADLCYVKDCAKAIALVQLVRTLNHSIYNIGGGRSVTNAELVASIRRSAPDFTMELSPGTSTLGQPDDAFLDLTWLRADTAYASDYSFDEAIADYIAWLRTGHEL